jgi:major intracellular serine protease
MIELPSIQLIPYQVEALKEKLTEIPPGVQMIQAPSMWRQGYKGENIVIAVIDTGCQIDHPDLKGQIIGGYNFTSDYQGNPNNFSDNHGHGTHVCGIIAARENGRGMAGVAPKAKLLVLKGLTGKGKGTAQTITSAINYAVKWRGPQKEKVRIISLSLGSPTHYRLLHVAIKKAVQQNIMVVCAAGNSGDGNARTNEYSYPGSYPEVISVGSVNYRGQLSPFSGSNSEIDIVAPGEQIISTYPKNKYAIFSGTSMAAPHVSGALALLIEKYEKKYQRRLTESEIYAQLVKHTVSLGYRETEEGNGLVMLNNYRASRRKRWI